MEEQKSIVLVTVDCLRADHVGFLGYTRPSTPFLDSLAQESFVFPAAIVAGTPTYYSLPAVMASRHPLEFGRDMLGCAPGEPTLASVLQDRGYRTAAFCAGNPYISERFGYRHGFDTFTDFLLNDPGTAKGEVSADSSAGWLSRANRTLQRLRPYMGPLRTVYDDLYFEYCQRMTPEPESLDALRRFPDADVIIDHACKWVDSAGDGPIFLWLHLMDPHSPYYPKEDALALMGDRPISPSSARYLNSFWNRSDVSVQRLAAQRDAVIRLYDAGIRWADFQISRLIEGLRRRKRWDRCVFALTADHGEEFLEHGGRFHPPTKLSEELIRVPLLLRVPGIQKTKVGNSPFSLVHFAPTLLDAVHQPVPAEFRGRSYWPELQQGREQDTFAVSECVAGCTNPFYRKNRLGPRVLSVRDSRFKLVLHFETSSEALYDLESDPAEKAPLPPTIHGQVRVRLLEIARDHLRRSNDSRAVQMRIRSRLRDLQLEWKTPAGKASPVAF